MERSLDGRNAVVCGASRGIGRAIALAFAEAGAKVSVCARGEPDLRSVEAELAAHGRGVHAAQCDVADGAALEVYLRAAATALGGIDILVNNASAGSGGLDDDGWANNFGVDLMGGVRASEFALPWLSERNGSIIHVSSISGLRPSARTPSYGAMKAALIQYTRTQAIALAPRSIRVNCIAPGSTEFPGGSWESRRTTDPELYAATLARVPLGRLGNPTDIASVAVFLASDAARWVTGQTIVVDGGQSLT